MSDWVVSLGVAAAVGAVPLIWLAVLASCTRVISSGKRRADRSRAFGT